MTVLPEKQGPLLFQYRNYEVATARRNSKVVRRYSDFVWLLDCLHKRFPFRQLPLLPPKRVASKFFNLSRDPRLRIDQSMVITSQRTQHSSRSEGVVFRDSPMPSFDILF